MYHDLWLEFVESEWLQPGENCTARVKPSHPELFLEQVQVGEQFVVTEGSRIVARGRVVDFY
jgi:hypothetical protein